MLPLTGAGKTKPKSITSWRQWICKPNLPWLSREFFHKSGNIQLFPFLFSIPQPLWRKYHQPGTLNRRMHIETGWKSKPSRLEERIVSPADMAGLPIEEPDNPLQDTDKNRLVKGVLGATEAPWRAVAYSWRRKYVAGVHRKYPESSVQGLAHTEGSVQYGCRTAGTVAGRLLQAY